MMRKAKNQLASGGKYMEEKKDKSSSISGKNDFLTSFEFSDTITDILTKYDLLEKSDTKKVIEEYNRRKLVKIIGKVLKGEINPSNFDKSIKGEFGLSDEQAEVISKEINQRIFSKSQPISEKITEEPAKTRRSSTSPSIPEISQKYPRIQKKDDAYREPIE
jgi:hypothetical protein